MNILLASDDNYAPLLGVTVYSFLKNNTLEFDQINIIILDGGIKENNKSKIQTICNEFDNQITLNFIKYDNIGEIIGIELTATRALATYARLLICSLLDSDIDKILYLDCDALVVDSVKELWETDITDYYCGAVLDAGPKYINTFLEFPEDHDHFNAGMLLINLKLWRENDLENKFIEYILSKDGEVFHNDQGVINVVCENRILKLKPNYNILSPFFEVDYDNVLKWYGLDTYYSKEMVEDALKNPVFIHLTQFVYGRPWFNNAQNHPLREVFDSYVEKTPFKNEVYIDDNRHLKGKFFSFAYNYLPYSLVCGMFSIYRFVLTKSKKGSI